MKNVEKRYSKMRIEWQHYFMLIAKVAATRSGCNSRPTGAVIVEDKRILCTGFNGTIPGQRQCTDKGSDFCYRRSINGPEDDKYNVCPSVHAEANAINQAAKMGISVDGATMFCTLAPCYVCLKNIKSVGINEVFFELEYKSTNEKRDKIWSDFCSVGIKGYLLKIPNNVLIDVWNNFLFIDTSKRRL